MKLKRDTAIVSMVPVDHLVSPRTFYMFRHRCRIKDIPVTSIGILHFHTFVPLLPLVSDLKQARV